ncbi:CPBP family glutamic-type intramembrane protease [Deinococcus aerophilus]
MNRTERRDSRTIESSGQARAVVASAVLFGALHLGNLLYRDPAIVAAQVVGAFCFGLAFAALRMPCGS